MTVSSYAACSKCGADMGEIEDDRWDDEVEINNTLMTAYVGYLRCSSCDTVNFKVQRRFRVTVHA